MSTWTTLVYRSTYYPFGYPEVHEQWCRSVCKNILIEYESASILYSSWESRQNNRSFLTRRNPVTSLHHCSCIPGSLSGFSVITGGSADEGHSSSYHNHLILVKLWFFLWERAQDKWSTCVCLKARNMERSNFVDSVRQEAATFHVGAFWKALDFHFFIVARPAPNKRVYKIRCIFWELRFLSHKSSIRVWTPFRSHSPLSFCWSWTSLSALFPISFQFVPQISMSMDADWHIVKTWN